MRLTIRLRVKVKVEVELIELIEYEEASFTADLVLGYSH